MFSWEFGMRRVPAVWLSLLRPYFSFWPISHGPGNRVAHSASQRRLLFAGTSPWANSAELRPAVPGWPVPRAEFARSESQVRTAARTPCTGSCVLYNYSPLPALYILREIPSNAEFRCRRRAPAVSDLAFNCGKFWRDGTPQPGTAGGGC